MFEQLVNESFNEREQRILKFWKEKAVFEKSVENRKSSSHFTFYDGPPFATGLPHYGHLLAGTIKDVVLRYKAMKGFYAPRRFGWDCHGLPVENEIEKAFDLSGASSIENFGIGNFNEECRKIVLRYTSEWKSTVERMGRWVDFNKTYMTMDLSFMESVWWVFSELFKKGLVYEGLKVMPFSAKLGTPLSNFEASENYKEVDDPSITVAFESFENPNTFFLAWTTTPWTLISNLALMVSPQLTYVEIVDQSSKRHYILAANRLQAFYKKEEDYRVVDTFSGDKLAGRKYRPLFDYFKEQANHGAFVVLLEDSVSSEEGTGIVQTAPAFGEVDFYACQKAGIEPVCPIDNNGRFTKEIPPYFNLLFKEADRPVIQYLKEKQQLFHQATLKHRYPFCPRSDTPLMYKTVKTWFISVEKLKQELVSLNNQIHWTPGHIQSGRFGKWLAGARDWAISRNRYWGTPIPLWRSEDGDLLVLGSIEELEMHSGQKITDLHRHFIDDLVIEKNGKIYRRIPEVFDCWFESGSMPYAQNHYPFENRELFEENFPADFIAEGIDQTRGWFYTLHILSTALFNAPAFKNVIVNGLILAENGMKMSKRLKNYPDPVEVIEQYGADAIRLYMLNSPAVRGDDLAFSKAGVELVLRQVMIPLWNAHSFFITYARIDQWIPLQSLKPHSSEVLDQWIVSRLHRLIEEVEKGMDHYDLSKAVEPFVNFVDQLTNWYIRRSRRRFWEVEETPHRLEAFQTLYYVLIELTKVASPYIPFLAEAIYQNLKSENMPESVHLCDFPLQIKELRIEKLEQEMELVQSAVGLGHALRKEHKLKVRQPLARAHIISRSQQILGFLEEQKHLIAEELNVKEILFGQNEADFVSLKAKPNFRVLGKKLGKLMPFAQQAIQEISQEQLLGFMSGTPISILIQGEEVILNAEDIEIDRIVHEGIVALTDQQMTIALDTSLNEELIQEGFAREFVNKVNTMRREAALSVIDRINVEIETTEKVRISIEKHKSYVFKEILAAQVNYISCSGIEWDLNGERAVISISRLS